MSLHSTQLPNRSEAVDSSPAPPATPDVPAAVRPSHPTIMPSSLIIPRVLSATALDAEKTLSKLRVTAARLAPDSEEARLGVREANALWIFFSVPSQPQEESPVSSKEEPLSSVSKGVYQPLSASAPWNCCSSLESWNDCTCHINYVCFGFYCSLAWWLLSYWFFDILFFLVLLPLLFIFLCIIYYLFF